MRRGMELGLVVALVVGTRGVGIEEPLPFAPTSAYMDQQVQGWTIRVHGRFAQEQPELYQRTMELLEDQLADIVRRVPAKALQELRKVVIWVEEKEPHHPCMAYHPAEPWLVEHGMNPEKARGVEIANSRNFLIWCGDQPWMVLHELAHAYHHQALEGGFENAAVSGALKRAREEGLYEKVLHINGREERAYALTNPMEFFAEASEAFFGTNDFFPFVRAELGRYDPETLTILEELWGTKEGR